MRAGACRSVGRRGTRDASASAEASADADGGRERGDGYEATSATSAPTVTSGPTAAADAATDGVTLYAFGVQAPIFSATEWPPKDPGKAAEERHGVVRLGYLRKGEHVAREARHRSPRPTAPRAGTSSRPPARGFVCGKFATTDAHHKELKFAPHAPYMDRNLPYEYGLNLTPGTPLYRRIPLKSERRDNEKTLAHRQGPQGERHREEAPGERRGRARVSQGHRATRSRACASTTSRASPTSSRSAC